MAAKLLMSVAAILALFAFVTPDRALATAAALTGTVTSAEEGAMEGVVVSARRDGSTIRVSVLTDAQGRYNFPAGRLDPGHYQIAIRAVGYDLAGAAFADVTSDETTTADLKLKKTGNLAAQLTNDGKPAGNPRSGGLSPVARPATRSSASSIHSTRWMNSWRWCRG